MITSASYLISAALIFYILTIFGIIVLRKTRPDSRHPSKALGYPIISALYVSGAAVITVVLFMDQPDQTWPGLMIKAIGIPA